jgi:hypothetical protein
MAQITSIIGLQNLVNLQSINLEFHSLESIDLSNLPNLLYVDISDCDFPGTSISSLTSINLSGCDSLEELRVDDSDFSDGFPDLSELNNLRYIDFDDCDLVGSIDISYLPLLERFDFSQNEELTELIISSSQPLGFDGNELYVHNCALTQTAVDNILVTLSESEVTNGYIDLSGGTNAIPGTAGDAALVILGEKGWSWDVNTPPPGHVTVAASTDFDIAGDFTIEMFINATDIPGVFGGFPRLYSFGSYPAANAISIEAGGTLLYFWANNNDVIAGTFEPTPGTWHHICIQRSETTLYMYADGVLLNQTTYSVPISSQNLPLTIGYGNESQSEFKGLMSNFRWSDTVIYNTSGFTVPTAPLTNGPETVMLIFTGSSENGQLLDISGNNHNATNVGAIYSALNPFVGDNPGSLQMGTII